MMKLFVGILLITATLASSEDSSRIMGGQNATQDQFPYLVSLQSDGRLGNFAHFCGGAIYSENVVITTGHSVYGENYDNPEDLMIVAGELNLNTDSGNEQRINVTKITLHENYNSSTLYNDIALLTLATPLTFNPSVSSIAVQPEEVAPGTFCTVAGWGYLNYDAEATTTDLQFVDVPIVDTTACNANTSYHGDVNGVTDLCAGEAGKDTCQEDAGSPLVCDGLLTGLASWGYNCGLEGFPGVYTKISNYKDWIEANI